MHFGKKIKEVSEYKKLTVRDLSQKTGKTTAAVYDIFRKEDLGTDVLKQFADALEISLIDFFAENNANVQVITGNTKGIGINNGSNATLNFDKMSECLQKVMWLEREIIAKDKELAAREREIAAKDKIIDLLEKQNS